MTASYKKLFKLLIDRGMKKKELAEKAGISIATITKMGKDGAVVSSDVLIKICSALDCTMDDIVEIILGWQTNSIEVVAVEPFDAAFSNLESLLQLTAKSFDEVRQNIDKMPKGTRTVMDEVDKFLSKYTYLFAKFQ